ncbi:MAG: arylesterase [Thauera sp.]|nr:arylesterase [Thauera sp.]
MLRQFLTIVLMFMFGQVQANSILVWGDSLSAGYGLERGEDWPALLQQRLQAEAHPHQVINGSVSGETSAGGRSRLPAALSAHSPSIVILELGANDGLRGLPPAQMAANLNAMIDAAQAAGARVLLVGMQIPPNYGPIYTRRFSEVFSELATARQLAFVPFLLEGFATDASQFLDDGLHPTAAAQHKVLDTVWQELQPLLVQP